MLQCKDYVAEQVDIARTLKEEFDMTKTWFITGTSKGFGREWAEAALDRGDNVAATARNTDQLQPLVEHYGSTVLPMQLDVTDRNKAFAAVQQAAAHFGSLDIVVNNAGYGHFGMVEELSEDDIRFAIQPSSVGQSFKLLLMTMLITFSWRFLLILAPEWARRLSWGVAAHSARVGLAVRTYPPPGKNGNGAFLSWGPMFPQGHHLVEDKEGRTR